MSGYDDYRHFRHVPNVRDNVKAALGIDNGREPGPEDFNRAGPDARRHLLLILSTAKAVTADRYELDPFDSWGVLEQLQRMRDREAARRIFEAEQEPADFAALYLPRSGLATMQRGEPMIHGVLDRHTLAALSGRDQSYKSFVALDWLCCLATETPWLGHAVEPGGRGLYVVGEGAWGLEPRVAAWEAHHGVSVPDDRLQTRRGPVNLYRGGRALDDLIRRVNDEGIDFVVFDTLRRCTAGANLNLEADAGTVITHLDAVREATGDGAVLFVAHTDKADNDTRGSGVLEDDADIVWRASKLERGTALRLAKRKDGPEGLTHTLAARPVDGSLVLVESHEAGESSRPEVTQAKAAVIAAQKLAELDGVAEPSMRQVEQAMTTVKGSHDAKRAGIELAVAKGWLEERSGPRRSRLVRLVSGPGPNE